MYPHTNPQSQCPQQLFSPIPGSIFLYYISYKRQHGPARVLARCGVQSSGIFVALWPTFVMLSRYASSPVAGPRAPASRYSPDLKQCIHQLVRIFGPELIRINELIKTAGGGTSCKILKTLVAAPASKFRKRDISSASEKAFPDFFGH